MKTFLLMNKLNGNLVDGWVVTSPDDFFAGLWVFLPREHVYIEFEIIGEV